MHTTVYFKEKTKHFLFCSFLQSFQPQWNHMTETRWQTKVKKQPHVQEGCLDCCSSHVWSKEQQKSLAAFIESHLYNCPQLSPHAEDFCNKVHKVMQWTVSSPPEEPRVVQSEGGTENEVSPLAGIGTAERGAQLWRVQDIDYRRWCTISLWNAKFRQRGFPSAVLDLLLRTAAEQWTESMRQAHVCK